MEAKPEHVEHYTIPLFRNRHPPAREVPQGLDRHTLRVLASAMQKFAPHLALELTKLWDVTDLQNATALEELLAAAGAVENDAATRAKGDK